MKLLVRLLVVAAAFLSFLTVFPVQAEGRSTSPSATTVGPTVLAEQPPRIEPPRQWDRWDADDDGRITADEYARLDGRGQSRLKNWVQDLLDLYPDDDVREWAREHFDGFTYLMMDIPAPGIAEQIGDAPGAILEAGGDALRNVGESAADSVLGSVAEAVGDAAADLSGYLGRELARTGRPQLSADWYQEHYGRMLGWAGLLMVPLALASIGAAVARGDMSQVGQTLLQVPIAYLLGVMAVSLVSATAGLSMAMARSLVPSVQDSSRTIGTRVGNVLTDQPQMGHGLVLLIGLAIALAALATLLWLLITEAAVYAVVLFFPLAFAGRVWPATAAWGRRLLTLALALIGARVVIFALWGLAMDGLADTVDGDVPLRSALALAALLLMTATAPTAVLRLVPLVDGAEAAGSPGAVVQRGMTVAHHATSLARMGGLGRGGGRLPVTGQLAGVASRVPPGVQAGAAAGAAHRSGLGGAGSDGQGRASSSGDSGQSRAAKGPGDGAGRTSAGERGSRPSGPGGTSAGPGGGSGPGRSIASSGEPGRARPERGTRPEGGTRRGE